MAKRWYSRLAEKWWCVVRSIQMCKLLEVCAMDEMVSRSAIKLKIHLLLPFSAYRSDCPPACSLLPVLLPMNSWSLDIFLLAVSGYSDSGHSADAILPPNYSNFSTSALALQTAAHLEYFNIHIRKTEGLATSASPFWVFIRLYDWKVHFVTVAVVDNFLWWKVRWCAHGLSKPEAFACPVNH